MAADWTFPRRADAGGDGSAREAGSFLFWQRGWGRVENGRRGEDVEADFRFATDWIDRCDCGGAFGFECDLRGLGRSGHAQLDFPWERNGQIRGRRKNLDA